MTNEIEAVRGYDCEEVSSQDLIECFLDYVGAGYFRNLEYDEAFDLIATGEITEKDIIRSLGGFKV